jgi:hypothetical protein
MNKTIGSLLFLFQASFSWAQYNVPSTNIYFNSASNYLGVGISNPLTHLQVGGNVAATVDNTLSGFVQLWSDNAIIWKSGNQNGGLRLGSAADLAAGNWSEKMRITDGGLVGIGTYNPQRNLDINTTLANGGMRISYNNTGAILLHPNCLTQGSWNSITQPGDAGIIYQSYSGPNPGFGFVIAPWSNSSSGIRLDPNGNVGIGTATTGSSRLAVEGSIAARKMIVTQVSPWPDYVFDKNYPLSSLASVDRYIKAHHHLPDISSADSVARSGLDLGGNQAALLKKIEELTLYVISQQAQISRQQKHIEALEGQNRKLGNMQSQIDQLKTLLRK